MATYKRNGQWYIDYYVNGRRKREKIGPNKKFAETVLKKRKVDVAENKFLDIEKKNKIRFEEMARTYLETYSKPNKKSFRRDEVSIKSLTAFFGGKHLYEITPLLIEKYKVSRKKKVSVASVNRELACLKHMFTKAIEWGKARENPARKVKLFKENNKRIRYLEKEEIKALYETCAEHLKPIVAVALNTGMRKGKILNLKWVDIDFNREIIYLLDSKSGEGREVPINKAVKDVLIRIRKHPGSPYVFCDKEGNSYGDIKKSFFTALKKAGIIDFRFHDLRHTFASHLVMAGIDLNTVRELMGYKSLEMTLRYAHLSPDHKKRAVEILNTQMDTIWSPEGNKKKKAESLSLQRIENIGSYEVWAHSSAGRAADS